MSISKSRYSLGSYLLAFSIPILSGLLLLGLAGLFLGYCMGAETLRMGAGGASFGILGGLMAGWLYQEDFLDVIGAKPKAAKSSTDNQFRW